jgi:hypothetical protein
MFEFPTARIKFCEVRMDEMDKLQKIKSVYCPHEENYCLDNKDIEWLIEQAEKVERSKKSLDEMFENREKWRLSHMELEEKVEQLEADLNSLQNLIVHKYSPRIEELELFINDYLELHRKQKKLSEQAENLL